LRERSGAVEVFEDVVPVAGAMGGESTHHGAVINRNRGIHLYLRLRYRYIEAAGWSLAEFAGVL
jgi:hypothetical protein